jgi:hypothetical protein
MDTMAKAVRIAVYLIEGRGAPMRSVLMFVPARLSSRLARL